MDENVPTPILRNMAVRGSTTTKKTGLSISTPNTPTAVRKRAREVESCFQKLKDQLREEVAKNDDNETQIHQLKSENSSLRRKVSELNNTIGKLRSELYNHVESEVHERLKKEFDRLGSRFKDMEYSERSLKSTVSAYEEEMIELREQIASLTEELSQTKERLGEVNDVTNERNILIEEMKEIVAKYGKSEELRKLEVSTLTRELEEQKVYYEQRLASQIQDPADYSVLFDPDQDEMNGNLNEQNGPSSGKFESLGFVNELRCRELEEEIEQLTTCHDEEFKTLQATLVEMTGRNKDLEEENVQMKQRLDQVQGILSEMSQGKETLTNELEAARRDLTSMTMSFQSTKARNSELEEENFGIKKKLDQMEARNSELEEENFGIKKKLDQIEARMDDVFREKTALSTDLGLAKGDLNSALAQLETVRRNLDSTGQELDSTKKELGSVRAELGSTKEELVDSKEQLNELESLRNDLEVTRSENSDLREENLKLKGRVDQSREEVDSISRVMNSVSTELEATKKDLQLTRNELDSVKEDLQLTRNELDSVKRSLSKTEAGMESVEKNLESAEAELGRKSCVVERLESELKEANERLNEANERLNETKCSFVSSIDELKNQIISLNEEMVSLHGIVEKKEEEKNALKDEADSRKKRLDETIQQVELLEQEIISWKREKNDLEEEIVSWKQKEEKTNDHISSLNLRIESLTVDLDRKNHGLDDLLLQLQLAQNDIASKEKEIASKEEEIASKEKEIASKEEEIASKEKVVVELNQSVDVLKSRISSLLEKMESRDREIERLQQEVESKEGESSEEVIGLKSQLGKKEKELVESYKQIARVTSQYSECRKSRNELSDRFRVELEKEKRSREIYQNASRDLVVKLNVAQSELTNLQSGKCIPSSLEQERGRRVQLEAEVERLNKDLSQLNQLVNRKDQMIQKLKSQLSLADEDFKIIKMTKERLLKENSDLSLQLRDLREALLRNRRQSFSLSALRRPPPGSGAAFLMADEDGQYMI